MCVKEGTAIEANTAIVQLSGTELSRQVQSAADSLLNAQLSMSDTEKQMENYTITSPTVSPALTFFWITVPLMGEVMV